MKKFKKGEKVNYTGKGFLSFDKDDREMEFIEYVRDHDCRCLYKGEEILVRYYEISNIESASSDQG